MAVLCSILKVAAHILSDITLYSALMSLSATIPTP